MVESEQISRPIVLACDEAYAMPLAITLRSIAEANRSGWPLEFHVFSDGLPDDTRRKVFDSLPKGSASIRWVLIDLELFEDFATLSHISKVTYARFYIHEVFPDTVSRVLYLDADLLVLDDLRPVWETDLERSVVGAVLDGLDPKLKRGEPGLEAVPRVRDYFNAGVLLINLHRWRQERISERALEYLTWHPQSPFSDQDALNFACDGLWKKMDRRWNFQDFYENARISIMPPEKRPGIVHFVYRYKPWDFHIPTLNADFYDAYRRRTCFARSPLDKALDKALGFFQIPWHKLKGILSQYPLLQEIWRQVKGANQARTNRII
jgi:lipopolysaccharide biosynthesis glycosyltransferase